MANWFEKCTVEVMAIFSSTYTIFRHSDLCYFCINNNLYKGHLLSNFGSKVEIFLEQSEVAFLSTSKICENLNFSTEIQIFANFAG